MLCARPTKREAVLPKGRERERDWKGRNKAEKELLLSGRQLYGLEARRGRKGHCCRWSFQEEGDRPQKKKLRTACTVHSMQDQIILLPLSSIHRRVILFSPLSLSSHHPSFSLSIPLPFSHKFLPSSLGSVLASISPRAGASDGDGKSELKVWERSKGEGEADGAQSSSSPASGAAKLG